MEKQKDLDRSLLIKIGMREALLDKLDVNSVRLLIVYAMDNIRTPNLLNSLISLASMELHNKSGAIYLAAHDLVTPLQLKNLGAQQIKILIDDYEFHQDANLIAKAVKEFLIIQQQEKLFTKTGGAKGEYFIDPYEREELEETKDHL
jgi:hypothetical protein